MKLYRKMKVVADGKPRVGDSFGTLGVRPSTRTTGRTSDITVDATGMVHRGTEGMSTFDTPNQLDSRHVDWVIESDAIGGDLSVEASPTTPGRYHIVPARSMTLAEYQYLLAETRDLWERV
ncbi:MAG TPA: hypothetical protein VM533_11275 [Fimbriiglobus sp.]|nr:hypothetical protein [Fimbriiglobus sp.]